MRIGVISDTHSNYRVVARAVELLRAEQVELILHCGDIEDDLTVWAFHGIPTHFVLGNCDTQLSLIREAIRASGATLHEPHGSLDLHGCRIAWLHGHDHKLFRELEHSNQYEFLFYGHTHKAKEHQTGTTHVINPGALYRAAPKRFLILDLPTRRLHTITVPE